MEPTPTQPKKAISKTCFKCQQKAHLKYKNNLVVCGECFSFHVCLRSFRSVIRNHLEVFGKHNPLAVFYDGSVNSLMLAHNISANSLDNEKMKKKMFFQAKVVCLDFRPLALATLGGVAADLVEAQNKLAADALKHMGLDFVVLSCSDFEAIDGLVESFNRLSRTGGYREDYLRILERKFLIQYCLKHEYGKVLLPENTEQLAARSLKLLCKSRHNELVPQCSMVHTLVRDGRTLTLARPLSERSNREVFFYTKYNGVIQYACDRYDWLEADITPKALSLPGRGSINNLLVEFITDLQDEYLSTSSTILKTGERLKELTLQESPGLSECSFCWTVS